MMTRQHFELIAEGMALAKNDMPPRHWRMVVNKLAGMCERDNPRFDRTRFLKACGFTNTEVIASSEGGENWQDDGREVAGYSHAAGYRD